MFSRPFRRLAPALGLLCLCGAADLWRTGSLAVTAQIGPTSTPAPGDWRSRLTPLLPISGQVAQVMETRARFSMTEVRRRVLDAGGDPRLLDQMQVSAERGVAPLYDKRFKISETISGATWSFSRSCSPAANRCA